jgi:hypothetical protein
MFKKSSEKAPSLTPFTVAVLVIIVLTAAVMGIRNRFTHSEQNTTQDFSFQAGDRDSREKSLNELLDRVAKLIIFNRNETPTLAVVENVDLLRQRNLSFYENAQNGDIVLLWKDRVIIYSPERDIIVAATYLPTTNSTSTAITATTSMQAENVSEETKATSTAIIEKPVVEVRNGSGVVGRGKIASERLKTIGLDVLPAKDAKVRTPYEKTLIIVEDGKAFPSTLATIKNVISGDVVLIPAGEAPMKGEILIIVGQDYTP